MEPCVSQSGNTVPFVESKQDLDSDVQETCFTSIPSIARNKKTSFKLPVTLWVYGKKVQAEAQVDSGATTNFINRSFVKREHLVTRRLRMTLGMRMELSIKLEELHTLSELTLQ